MNIKVKYLIGIILLSQQITFAQYDESVISSSSVSIQKELYTTIKMSRSGDHVKVKYFASRASNGSSVYNRLNSWKKEKNIIAISSGTYMTNCNSNLAKPVGICIDNGRVENFDLRNDMDALVMIYATGGMVASNLKNGDLTLSVPGGRKTLDVRNNPFQKQDFIGWAESNLATVFQTHLLYYGNKIQIAPNSSLDKRERRFLAVGKNDTGEIKHYIVNLSGANTLYQATLKISKYLEEFEEVSNLTFLINLDTGCQDVFEFYNKNGKKDNRKGFSGRSPVTQATNLIVYYYE